MAACTRQHVGDFFSGTGWGLTLTSVNCFCLWEVDWCFSRSKSMCLLLSFCRTPFLGCCSIQKCRCSCGARRKSYVRGWWLGVWVSAKVHLSVLSLGYCKRQPTELVCFPESVQGGHSSRTHSSIPGPASAYALDLPQTGDAFRVRAQHFDHVHIVAVGRYEANAVEWATGI